MPEEKTRFEFHAQEFKQALTIVQRDDETTAEFMKRSEKLMAKFVELCGTLSVEGL